MNNIDIAALRVMQEAAEYCARQSGYGHHDATVHLPPDVLKALLDRVEAVRAVEGGAMTTHDIEKLTGPATLTIEYTAGQWWATRLEEMTATSPGRYDAGAGDTLEAALRELALLVEAT